MSENQRWKYLWIAAVSPFSFMELPSRSMAVYALFFWLVIRVVRIAANRPSARTLTRSTREQTPGGGEERTTHTTTRR